MKKCLNEWNATIEALGNGKQTILIRKYATNLKEFLLYPTISYTSKNDYLQSFKNKYQPFAKENALPNRDGKKFEVKYYAKVENVTKKPPSKLGYLKNYHIWTPEHVKSYIGRDNAYVWILRVYKLKEPVIVERTRGMRYANTLEEVSLEGMEPVLSDNMFLKIINKL